MQGRSHTPQRGSLAPRSALPLFFPLVLAAALVGCRDAEPPRLLSDSPSPARDAYFEAAVAGDYDALDAVIEALEAESDGGDAESTAVLGFAHAWKLSERRRVAHGEDITEHAASAVDAFDEAFRALDDPRLLGFRGSFRQAVGAIEDRAALQREGWFDQSAARRRWPEWGGFTQAYGLITRDPSANLYAQGLNLLWSTLDDCLETEVSRTDFDFGEHLDAFLEDADVWNRRGCGNTPVAPHNTEGFFVVFGDLLARAGDLDAAERMYRAALLLPTAESWPHRGLADSRIDRLSELPDLLVAAIEPGDAVEATETAVFGGPASCSICHQGSAAR